MKYRHLDGKTEYYPFDARTHLRRQQSRCSALLLLAGGLLLAAAALLAARQLLFHGGQPAAPTASEQTFPEALVAEGTATASAQNPDRREVLPLYARLHTRNPDLIGWLTVQGTKISYPVMQTPGDNEHYLRLGFDGLYAPGGSLFLDERCSVTLPTANLLIYGHNMADGSMFAELLQYADPDFGAQHATIHFDSLYETGSWQLLAALYGQVDADNECPYYTFFDAATPDEWQARYDRICADALYDTGVSAQYGDQLLTLSTCAESFPTDKRFAVVAKRIQQ